MYGIGYEKSDVKTKRTGSGFKILTSDSRFPKLQENFEHNLGKYAYKNKNAISAVDKGLAKMRKVLVTYYKDKYSNIKDQAEREAQICLDAFTNTDDPTSAGQVGKIKYKQLCEIIESNIPQGDKEINSQIDKQTGMAGASNLREKMTAFYNAAYYKGYKDKNPEENITNFKNIAQKIAVGGQSELVDELDLDSSILEEQKNTSTDPRKAGIVRALYNAGAGHKVIGFFGKIARIFNKDFDKDKQFSNRMHTRDVYDMALISLGQKSMGAKLDNVRSGSNLRYRGEEEQKEVQRSLDYYNNMGLDLSERERNYILETVSAQYLTSHPVPEKSKDETIETFNQRIKDHAVKYSVYMDKVRKKIDPSYTPEESLEKKLYQKFADDPSLNEEVEKTKSPIKEGIVYKDIPKKGGFLKDIMVDKHNVRIVNGISMTTARMLKTYKWLNLKSDLKNFRLALMGWMLPTDDHSLWEIIIGSHNVGVKGKEDLTDIVSLDQTVDPLSETEIRHNVCEPYLDNSRMFPHEIVLWKQRFESGGANYQKTLGEDVNESTANSKGYEGNNVFLTEEELSSYASLNSELGKLEMDLSNKENTLKDLKIVSKKFSNLGKGLEAKLKPSNKSKKSGKGSAVEDTSQIMKEFKINIENANDIQSVTNLFKTYLPLLTNTDWNNQLCVSEANNLKSAFDTKSKSLLDSLKEQINELDSEVSGMKAKKTSKDNEFKQFYSKHNNNVVSKLAVLNYTSNMYKAINIALALNSTSKAKFISRAMLKRQQKKAIIDMFSDDKKTYDMSSKDRKKFDDNISLEGNLVLSALKSAPRKSFATVYSGTWDFKAFSKFKLNHTTTLNMVQSNSKSKHVAKGFIGGEGGKTVEQHPKFLTNALLEIKLKGKNAVDITQDKDKGYLSVQDAEKNNEEEILLPPGAKYQVKEIIKNVNLTKYCDNSDNKPEIQPINRNKTNKEASSEDEKANSADKQLNVKDRIGTLVKCEEV